MKTTVIYHSADFDGIFCREIARKFLPDAEFIGWNFGDPLLSWPTDGTIYVMDLPIDRVFGSQFSPLMLDKPVDPLLNRLIWIDHHKSSIESHPTAIPGYRIDGVAACRLAWQWFNNKCDCGETPTTVYCPHLPTKDKYQCRVVDEPLSVRLAGEYDVWDHRGDGDLEFQYGMRVEEPDTDWGTLLRENTYAERIVNQGKLAMRYARNMDAMWLSESWHIVELEGVKFLAQNSVQRGSGIHDSKDVPETGHDALMLYGFRGKYWTVSMYHAKHRKDLDLSEIAKKHGGGGHKGACGFTCKTLPFSL